MRLSRSCLQVGGLLGYAGKDYVADDAYSIADMSLYPWVAHLLGAAVVSFLLR